MTGCHSWRDTLGMVVCNSFFNNEDSKVNTYQFWDYRGSVLVSDSGDMEVFIYHTNTETWQGHLLWRESDVLACGPPASFSVTSVHLASSAVIPAGSVHKSRSDNVVRMWVKPRR